MKPKADEAKQEAKEAKQEAREAKQEAKEAKQEAKEACRRCAEDGPNKKGADGKETTAANKNLEQLTKILDKVCASRCTVELLDQVKHLLELARSSSENGPDPAASNGASGRKQ